jgi:hypothetical protein
MTADHDDGETKEYDPERTAPPATEPPLRRTAPQSEFTMGQVGLGVVVLIVGLVLTFGLPLLL